MYLFIYLFLYMCSVSSQVIGFQRAQVQCKLSAVRHWVVFPCFPAHVGLLCRHFSLHFGEIIINLMAWKETTIYKLKQP